MQILNLNLGFETIISESSQNLKFETTSSNITYFPGQVDLLMVEPRISVTPLVVSPQLLLFYLLSSYSVMEMSQVQILLRLQNEQIPNRKFKFIMCNQALELHGWQTAFQSIKWYQWQLNIAESIFH